MEELRVIRPGSSYKRPINESATTRPDGPGHFCGFSTTAVLRFANSYNERVLKLNALDRIRKAARSGDPFAQFEIAVSLDYAYDGRRDFGRASDWYAKAALQGHQTASGNLLLQHVRGQATLRQPKAVFSELKKLAESGDRDTENNLGLCYQVGYGTTVDYRKAAVWYRRSARSGSAEAQFNLGGFYFEGKGRRKWTQFASVRSAWVYQVSRAGVRACPDPARCSMYQKGVGIEPNLHRALVLYLIAYRRGSVRAAVISLLNVPERLTFRKGLAWRESGTSLAVRRPLGFSRYLAVGGKTGHSRCSRTTIVSSHRLLLPGLHGEERPGHQFQSGNCQKVVSPWCGSW